VNMTLVANARDTGARKWNFNFFVYFLPLFCWNNKYWTIGVWCSTNHMCEYRVSTRCSIWQPNFRSVSASLVIINLFIIY
jgi:hypothetical protein